MISRIGYRRDLEPASFKRVTIGDSLKAAWGRTQMEVPVEGDWEALVKGERRQAHPLPFQPSGLRPEFTNKTLADWFTASQLLTSFYGALTTADPEDEKYALIRRFVRDNAQAGGPAVPGIGKVFTDPGYWDYNQRKMDQEQEVAYKLWKYEQIDAMTPEAREFWMEKCPEFVPQLQMGMKQAMKMLRRVANIRIRGIQNEEDLRFLWKISVGAYQPPKSKKTLPPMETIESDQFPGLATDRNAPFPGVSGPSAIAPQGMSATGTGPSRIISTKGGM